MHSSVHQTENLLFLTLLQLIVMIFAARAGNRISKKLGQPGVIGEIVAGLLLGPSLFGHYFPGASIFLFGVKASAPITIISQIGLVLLMFQIGMDFEFSHLSRAKNRNGVFGIAAASITIPFALGFGMRQNLGADPGAAHQCDGLQPVLRRRARHVTAVPILGRILREFDLTRTELGVVAIYLRSLQRCRGLGVAGRYFHLRRSDIFGRSVGIQVGGILLLAAVSWFGIRPLIDLLMRIFPVVDGEMPPSLMTIVISTDFSWASAPTNSASSQSSAGSCRPVCSTTTSRLWRPGRAQVGKFVLVFFLPVFFTYTGLRTNVLGLSTAADRQWLAVMLAAAILEDDSGIYRRPPCGFNHASSTILGIVDEHPRPDGADCAQHRLSTWVHSADVFTMLVIMAVTTT